MSGQPKAENIVARISKIDGPYITSAVYRASYTSSSSRPNIEIVEDHFKELEEGGFGRKMKEGKSYVFFRETPTNIAQDNLDRLGNTREQYYEIFHKTPPETTMERFGVILRKSPFYNDILHLFEARLPKEPKDNKKNKTSDN